jgi:hypothetical protein
MFEKTGREFWWCGTREMVQSPASVAGMERSAGATRRSAASGQHE